MQQRRAGELQPWVRGCAGTVQPRLPGSLASRAGGWHRSGGGAEGGAAVRGDPGLPVHLRCRVQRRQLRGRLSFCRLSILVRSCFLALCVSLCMRKILCIMPRLSRRARVCVGLRLCRTTGVSLYLCLDICLSAGPPARPLVRSFVWLTTCVSRSLGAYSRPRRLQSSSSAGTTVTPP